MTAANVDASGNLLVNVAAGAAGGGVAQIQARSTANTWTDVGFAVGDLYLPVIGQGSTQVIGHVIIDSATITALTDGSQITQVSTLPALTLSTSTASIGHVAVDSLPSLILSTSTASIGHVVMDTGSTATVTVSTLPALILSTSTAQIGHVVVDTLPTVVLSTSTASIGHIIVDSGSLDANITNLVLTVSGTVSGKDVESFGADYDLAKENGGNLANLATHQTDGTQKAKITDGTNVMTLSTQGSTTITGLISNAPMAITGDNRPSWDTDRMEPLSQTLAGRLRVYQGENERLIRHMETQTLLEHGDRQYSRDYRTPGFMSDRAYSR